MDTDPSKPAEPWKSVSYAWVNTSRGLANLYYCYKCETELTMLAIANSTAAACCLIDHVRTMIDSYVLSGQELDGFTRCTCWLTAPHLSLAVSDSRSKVRPYSLWPVTRCVIEMIILLHRYFSVLFYARDLELGILWRTRSQWRIFLYWVKRFSYWDIPLARYYDSFLLCILQVGLLIRVIMNGQPSQPMDMKPDLAQLQHAANMMHAASMQVSDNDTISCLQVRLSAVWYSSTSWPAWPKYWCCCWYQWYFSHFDSWGLV